MLYAVIRCGSESLHFLGKVSAYNIQTLRNHARQSTETVDALQLLFEIAPADQQAFVRCTKNWLSHLRRCGAKVEVKVMRPVEGVAAALGLSNGP